MMDEREDAWPWVGGRARHAPELTWHEGVLWGQSPPTRQTAGREPLARLYRARARRALLVAVALSVTVAATVAVLGLVDLGGWAVLVVLAVMPLTYGACHALGRAETLRRRAQSMGG